MLSNHLSSRLGLPHGRGGNPPPGRGRGGVLTGRGRGNKNIPHQQPAQTNQVPINYGGNGNFPHQHPGPGPNNSTTNPQPSMYGPALSNVAQFYAQVPGHPMYQGVQGGQGVHWGNNIYMPPQIQNQYPPNQPNPYHQGYQPVIHPSMYGNQYQHQTITPEKSNIIINNSSNNNNTNEPPSQYRNGPMRISIESPDESANKLATKLSKLKQFTSNNFPGDGKGNQGERTSGINLLISLAFQACLKANEPNTMDEEEKAILGVTLCGFRKEDLIKVIHNKEEAKLMNEYVIENTGCIELNSDTLSPADLPNLAPPSITQKLIESPESLNRQEQISVLTNFVARFWPQHTAKFNQILGNITDGELPDLISVEGALEEYFNKKHQQKVFTFASPSLINLDLLTSNPIANLNQTTNTPHPPTNTTTIIIKGVPKTIQLGSLRPTVCSTTGEKKETTKTITSILMSEKYTTSHGLVESPILSVSQPDDGIGNVHLIVPKDDYRVPEVVAAVVAQLPELIRLSIGVVVSNITHEGIPARASKSDPTAKPSNDPTLINPLKMMGVQKSTFENLSETAQKAFVIKNLAAVFGSKPEASQLFEIQSHVHNLENDKVKTFMEPARFTLFFNQLGSKPSTSTYGKDSHKSNLQYIYRLRLRFNENKKRMKDKDRVGWDEPPEELAKEYLEQLNSLMVEYDHRLCLLKPPQRNDPEELLLNFSHEVPTSSELRDYIGLTEKYGNGKTKFFDLWVLSSYEYLGLPPRYNHLDGIQIGKFVNFCSRRHFMVQKMERTIGGYIPCIALPCSLARDNIHQIKDELIKRTKIVTDGDSPEEDIKFSQQYEIAWITVSTESDRATMMHCVLAKPENHEAVKQRLLQLEQIADQQHYPVTWEYDFVNIPECKNTALVPEDVFEKQFRFNNSLTQVVIIGLVDIDPYNFYPKIPVSFKGLADQGDSLSSIILHGTIINKEGKEISSPVKRLGKGDHAARIVLHSNKEDAQQLIEYATALVDELPQLTQGTKVSIIRLDSSRAESDAKNFKKTNQSTIQHSQPPQLQPKVGSSHLQPELGEAQTSLANQPQVNNQTLSPTSQYIQDFPSIVPPTFHSPPVGSYGAPAPLYYTKGMEFMELENTLTHMMSEQNEKWSNQLNQVLSKVEELTDVTTTTLTTITATNEALTAVSDVASSITTESSTTKREIHELHDFHKSSLQTSNQVHELTNQLASLQKSYEVLTKHSLQGKDDYAKQVSITEDIASLANREIISARIAMQDMSDKILHVIQLIADRNKYSIGDHERLNYVEPNAFIAAQLQQGLVIPGGNDGEEPLPTTPKEFEIAAFYVAALHRTEVLEEQLKAAGIEVEPADKVDLSRLSQASQRYFQHLSSMLASNVELPAAPDKKGAVNLTIPSQDNKNFREDNPQRLGDHQVPDSSGLTKLKASDNEPTNQSSDTATVSTPADSSQKQEAVTRNSIQEIQPEPDTDPSPPLTPSKSETSPKPNDDHAQTPIDQLNVHRAKRRRQIELAKLGVMRGLKPDSIIHSQEVLTPNLESDGLEVTSRSSPAASETKEEVIDFQDNETEALFNESVVNRSIDLADESTIPPEDDSDSNLEEAVEGLCQSCGKTDFNLAVCERCLTLHHQDCLRWTKQTSEYLCHKCKKEVVLDAIGNDDSSDSSSTTKPSNNNNTTTASNNSNRFGPFEDDSDEDSSQPSQASNESNNHQPKPSTKRENTKSTPSQKSLRPNCKPRKTQPQSSPARTRSKSSINTEPSTCGVARDTG